MSTHKSAVEVREGRGVESAYACHYFICSMYFDQQGKSVYKKTIWWCSNCHMPLCGSSYPLGQSCHAEHKCSTDEDIECFGIDQDNQLFPKTKQVSWGVHQLFGTNDGAGAALAAPPTNTATHADRQDYSLEDFTAQKEL